MDLNLSISIEFIAQVFFTDLAGHTTHIKRGDRLVLWGLKARGFLSTRPASNLPVVIVVC